MRHFFTNRNRLRGHIENDELGGESLYSYSKATAHIATQSWAKSFNLSPVAIARAGNVISGRDWAMDRISLTWLNLTRQVNYRDFDTRRLSVLGNTS